MSELSKEDAAPPGQLVVPEFHFPVLNDDPDDHARFALYEPDTVAVSALLAPPAAGTVGDALAEAVPPLVAEGYGWTRYQSEPVDLPVTVEGVEGGTVRVDEAPEGRALLRVDAGGASLAAHLSHGSAFGAASVLWGRDDEHE
jgi:hypothetical protein